MLHFHALPASNDRVIKQVGETRARGRRFRHGFRGVGARERVSVTSTPYPVAYRGAWRWGRAYYNDVDVRQYTEGRLAIDIFDAKEKRPVWHGYATANVSSATDRAERQALLREAVTKILAEFPPKDP